MFALTDVPFSRAGSYLSLNYLSGHDGDSDAVVLRTTRGGVSSPDLLRVEPSSPPPEPRSARFTPAVLTVPAADGEVSIAFTSTRALTVTAGAAVSLVAEEPGPHDAWVDLAPGRFRYSRVTSETVLEFEVLAGDVRFEQDWDGARSTSAALVLERGAVVAVTERDDEPDRSGHGVAVPSWEEWWAAVPEVRGEHRDGRLVSAYVTWSSIVDASGLLSRPTMLMSKNWMTRVWSWDHCFNALAAGSFPDLAWAQVTVVFDRQSPHGNLPDCVSDRVSSYGYVKPPVHGWTLRLLRERGTIGAAQCAALFPALERWTQWWLTERVAPGRRLPHYLHGNDSGWDNSTVFLSGVPVESPDLAAHLVVQMDVLAEIAAENGAVEAAARWTVESQRLLDALLEELWEGDRFTAVHTPTGRRVDSASLLLSMPLVLGERLPPEVFSALADRLETGGYRTPWGVATEPVDSPHFDPDGYWRGPVWAPATHLLVDGLRRGGATALAGDLADRFCRLVARSGSAENFDPLTGAGNRDGALTWTASTFLVLAAELHDGRLVAP